ncbi:MAG: Mut7-C RNAse domain-containing protein [Nitrospirae bacterium]|nr:Mut7-C RNAse domain-containing protein [Nitrospirota bacterium]MBI3393799.1 Mut7-C RNAse domain-containing protein [Nitrospirota bacterium]
MEHRFIADAMLGRLARWLRALGCDVEYFPEISDKEIAERAEHEGRVILTRDTLLIRRRNVRDNHFFVEGDHYPDQLRQVVRRFGIDPRSGFLTRCVECNAILEDCSGESVRDKVPLYVFETQEAFKICPSCRRVYWPATHRARIVAKFEEMLGKA